jgi:16S rRNA processing protein RimM
MAVTNRVLVGVVAGAHRVRGAVRAAHRAPGGLAAYARSHEAAGHRADRRWAGAGGAADRPHRGGRGPRRRRRAPGPPVYVAHRPAGTASDEYYCADLIGLAVELPDGSPFGRVAAVDNFGAGDVMEIERPAGGALSVPFTKAVVPVVDPAGGRIVLDPPPGLLENPEAPPRRKAAKPQRQRVGEAGKA